MPKGLCNAPATSHTLMKKIFHGFIDLFMVAYMDDLLVYSGSREAHMDYLRTFLSRL